MTSSLRRGVRRQSWVWTLLLLASGTMMALPAYAQDDESGRRRANLPPGAVVQPLDNGASEELRRNLNRVGENPGSASVLIDAGRAALAMGDAQAALTFFSRAEEASPRDARVRAGMAAAMAQLGQPEAALTLFQEALGFGAPEVEIAGDRGLAYDMMGDPARAQRDYALVLRRRDEPEVRRRMALSLAISGQREAALRMIEGQLRNNDRAAWRTQAFVLALTGDAAGANRTAQGVMPPGAAQAMAPFLARLSGLSPAQKARAVHLGHFPADGRVQYAGNADTSADPGALALAQGGRSVPTRERQAERDTDAERRRPGAVSPLDRAAVGRRRTVLNDSSERPRVIRPAPRVPGPSAPPPRERVEVAEASPPRNVPVSSPPVQRFQPVPEPPPPRRFGTEPAPSFAGPATSQSDALPGFSLTPQGVQP
ncbi:MAG: tetratricopeptide repeat protein, partial [Sphingosinicella sp.]